MIISTIPSLLAIPILLTKTSHIIGIFFFVFFLHTYIYTIFHSSHECETFDFWMDECESWLVWNWNVREASWMSNNHTERDEKITKVIVFVIWIKNVMIFIGFSVGFLYYVYGAVKVWCVIKHKVAEVKSHIQLQKCILYLVVDGMNSNSYTRFFFSGHTKDFWTKDLLKKIRKIWINWFQPNCCRKISEILIP